MIRCKQAAFPREKESIEKILAVIKLYPHGMTAEERGKLIGSGKPNDVRF
ncbi:hypothetical protein [Anoxybacteroides tepidamans]|nr:hypothetical protein [Anoxybacillus tepidamans]